MKDCDFSSENIETRKEWNNIFKALREKTKPGYYILKAKISLKIESQTKPKMKADGDERKLREFITRQFAIKILHERNYFRLK